MIHFMEDLIDSYCGMDSSKCGYVKAQLCDGCTAKKGNPAIENCEIVACATTRNKRFCGECEDFPCEKLERYAYDKEHGDNGKRIECCKEIKANMVRTARENISLFGYCGHHCDFCFLKQWCGGCRSEYNCCSMAIWSEDGVCANVACAKEKGLENCGFCDELLKCKKGFYTTDAAYATKAKALFIKEYGEECYLDTLKRAIDSDENFASSFDVSKSVDDAYKILESFKINK